MEVETTGKKTARIFGRKNITNGTQFGFLYLHFPGVDDTRYCLGGL